MFQNPVHAKSSNYRGQSLICRQQSEIIDEEIWIWSFMVDKMVDLRLEISNESTGMFEVERKMSWPRNIHLSSLIWNQLSF